jgi:hypothetical protein
MIAEPENYTTWTGTYSTPAQTPNLTTDNTDKTDFHGSKKFNKSF